MTHPLPVGAADLSASERGRRTVLSGLGLPLFFLALAAGLVAKGASLLQDPDTQWHIAVGRRIRELGAVPWTDPFSHTFAGQPWIAKEWLSQVLLSAVHDAGGWSGLVLFTALVLAGSLTLLFALLTRRLPATTALILVLVTMVLGMGHFIARPHMLTLPVLVLWTALVVDAAERRRAPSAWLIPLMALWANLHASYAIAFVVAGAMGLEALAAAPGRERAGLAARWAAVLGLAGLAALATPYGVTPVLVAISLFGSGEPLAYITEWQPLAFDLPGVLALATLAAALACLSRDWRRNLFRIALVLALGALMIRHSRFMTLFGVVAVLVTATPLSRLVSSPAEPRVALRRGAVLAVLAAGLAGVMALSVWTAPVPSRAVTPQAALAAARAAGLTGPVYNSYDFGGFLILEGEKTFIDGRTDQLFLGGFMAELYRAILAGDTPAFSAMLDRHGVTWALVRAGTREGALLAGAGWRPVFADEVALVYARPR